MSPNKTKQKNEGKKSDLDILKYCTEILIKREKRNKYQKEVKRNAEERTQEAKTPFFWQSLNQSRNGLSVVCLLAPKDTAWKAERRSNQPKTREMRTKLFTRSKWQYWKLTIFRQKIATLFSVFNIGLATNDRSTTTLVRMQLGKWKYLSRTPAEPQVGDAQFRVAIIN